MSPTFQAQWDKCLQVLKVLADRCVEALPTAFLLDKPLCEVWAKLEPEVLGLILLEVRIFSLYDTL